MKQCEIAKIILTWGNNCHTRDLIFIRYYDKFNNLKTITYREFLQKSCVLGNLIHRERSKRRKKKNDRFHVGAYMQNIPEYLFLLGACSFTNSTLVGMNSGQFGDTLGKSIELTQLDLLFSDYTLLPGTDKTYYEHSLDIVNRTVYGVLRGDSVYRVSDIDFEDSETFRPYEQSRNTAVIIFTSGTTGVPKGIEVSWEKLYDTGKNITKLLHYTKDDVGYVCMPINHSNSLYLNIIPALINGASLFLRRKFSVSRFVDDLQCGRVTIWNSVGDPVQYLLSYFERKFKKQPDFQYLPLRTVISTGTNGTNRKLFSEIFGLDIFTEIYGSTEVGALSSVDELAPDYTVGKILKDVRIYHEEKLCECPTVEMDHEKGIKNITEAAGEIIVRQSSLGDSKFEGYFNAMGESSRKLLHFKDNIYYRMGDLGAIEEKDGKKYLIFLGRTGDWVRSKGENWASSECEKILLERLNLSNVAVIGIPQSVGKEDDPMFIFEVDTLDNLDINSIISKIFTIIPRYMYPKYIRFIPKMPLTETLKIKKSILKYQFFYRNLEIDLRENDLVFKINPLDEGTPFFTEDFVKELRKFKDPINQGALKTFTKRSDLF